MNLLLNPNVAYLLLVSGVFLAVLAVLSPGTGMLEVSALFILLTAGYSMYNLPINAWALVLLLAGVFPFILALRKSGRIGYFVIAMLAMVVGSAFLFRSQVWWQPAVNPLLTLTASLLTAGFLWLATRKILEAEKSPATHDLEAIIGQIGEAKDDIYQQGSVQVAGELWSAYSERPIPAGSKVRVVHREGFTLLVEQVE